MGDESGSDSDSNSGWDGNAERYDDFGDLGGDPGELRTLTEAGISSISLTGDGVERSAIAA